MMREDLYTEHPGHKEIPLIDDLFEAGSVMFIGMAFLFVFVLIMTFLVRDDSEI